jgi:hypothetical protein
LFLPSILSGVLGFIVGLILVVYRAISVLASWVRSLACGG